MAQAHAGRALLQVGGEAPGRAKRLAVPTTPDIVRARFEGPEKGRGRNHKQTHEKKREPLDHLEVCVAHRLSSRITRRAALEYDQRRTRVGHARRFRRVRCNGTAELLFGCCAPVSDTFRLAPVVSSSAPR